MAKATTTMPTLKHPYFPFFSLLVAAHMIFSLDAVRCFNVVPGNLLVGMTGRALLPNSAAASSSQAAAATAASSPDSPPSSAGLATQHRRMGEMTPPEEVAYNVLGEVRDSGYGFRVVVVGRGGSAILEATCPRLGPLLSVSQSPSSGRNMLTLASEDKSFEFHLQLSDVAKMVFVTKEVPSSEGKDHKRVMRILRILNASGDPMASLILQAATGDGDGREDGAVKWFEGMIEKHGSDIQL